MHYCVCKCGWVGAVWCKGAGPGASTSAPWLRHVPAVEGQKGRGVLCRALCDEAPLSLPSSLSLARPCVRPTNATKDLLDKLIYRVESENGWDQALFNECIFFPNSPGNKVGGGSAPGAANGERACGKRAQAGCWPPHIPSCLPRLALISAAVPPLAVQDPAVTRRVLDYMKFMNSKVEAFTHPARLCRTSGKSILLLLLVPLRNS